MKKWIALILMLALLLTGCAKKEKIVVNTAEHTISDGTYTYEYTDTTEGDVRTIVIRYPDGGTYTWTQDSLFGSGNMEHGSSMETYTDGYALLQAVRAPAKEVSQEENHLKWVLILVGGLVAVMGLLKVLYPVKAWDILMRWYYKEDPGEYALTRIISSGIRLTILGIVLVILALLV